MCFPVNKCCFCVNLNLGAKIIAVLSLVTYILTLAVYAGAAFSLPSMPQSKQSFYIFAATVAACQSLCSSLLVYGSFWRKPRYLWPWLVTSWLWSGVLVSLSILGVVLLSLQYYEDVETTAEISTTSSIYFVHAAILCYCTTVVNSRRHQMIREEEIESAESLMRQRDVPKSLLV